MIERAELYLNGCLVGRIKIKRLMGAWGFGDFVPGSAFAAFRQLYDEWARLMHSDGDAPLDSSTAAALSRVEYAMDRIRGQLRLEDGKWCSIAQLNIDGDLVEWEEHDVFIATDRRIAGSQRNLGDDSVARGGLEMAN